MAFFCFMDNLLAIYFVLAILLIIASIIFGFLWFFYNLMEDSYWNGENSREERKQLMSQFLQQLQLMQQERKDLYDRLQAGTLPQYKQHVDEENNSLAEQEDENIVGIEDAKDEIMGITPKDK